MELKKSKVQFNADSHTYFLGETQLSGITGMINNQLFPGSFDNIPKEILENARLRGTNGHNAIDLFLQTGVPSDIELIDGLRKFIEDNNVIPVETEYVVSDEVIFASPIDMVDAEFNLYDWKFTSVLNKSYLQWQLSLYAYLFELQNGFPPKKLYAVHIKDNVFTKVPIERLSDDKLLRLMECELNGTPYVQNELEAIDYQTLILLENELLSQKAILSEIDERHSALKELVRAQMVNAGVKSLDFDGLKITVVEDTTAKTFDAKRFKEENPELAADYERNSTRKGYLKLTIKK